MGKINSNNILGNQYIGSIENYNKRMENLHKAGEIYIKSNNFMKLLEDTIKIIQTQHLLDSFISHIFVREFFYNENKDVIDKFNLNRDNSFEALFSDHVEISQEDFIIEFDKSILKKICELRNQIVHNYSLRIDENDVEKGETIYLLKNSQLLMVSQFILEPELWFKIILNDLAYSSVKDKNEIISSLRSLCPEVERRTNNNYIKIYDRNNASEEKNNFNYEDIFESQFRQINIDELIGLKAIDKNKNNPNKLELHDEYSIQGLINLIYVLLSLNKSETLDSLDLEKSIEKTIKESITKRENPPYPKINFDDSVPKLLIPIEMKKKIIRLFYYLDKYSKIFDHRKEKGQANTERLSNYFHEFFSQNQNIFNKSIVKRMLQDIKGKEKSDKDVSKDIGLTPNQIQNLLTNSIPDIEKFIKNLR